MTPSWRPMVAADLETVAAIERESHNPLPPEGLSVFADRLALFPAGCFVAGCRLGRPVGGYALAHPWAGPAPALGSVPLRLPESPDHLLLHDVAILPPLRGQGLAAAVVALLCRVAAAQGLAELRLVSVHATQPMWARLGFVADGPMAAAGYGEGAVPMRLAPVATAAQGGGRQPAGR